MPLDGRGRIMQVEDHRTVIYVSQRVATDSQWPFKPHEAVELRIDPATKQLIIGKLHVDSSQR